MSAEKVDRKESKLDKAKQAVDYDDLLSSAGELGRYQWTLFFSTFPFYAFGVFVYFAQMFLTEVSPNHWCRIPELDNFTDIQRRELGVPKDEYSRFGYSQCSMYDVNWTDVLTTGQKPDLNWKTIPCQHGWEFNKSEIPYPTIGMDLEWVCDKNSYQATAQSIFFIGSICGGLLFGWVADRYGRLPAIILSCLAGFAGGLTSTFARNFWEFSATRFVTGMAYDSCLNMAYLLLLEYIAPRYRTLLANMAYGLFYSLFVTILPWIALACGHWKTISLVTSIPLAFGVLTKVCLPESPRWLLSKGRVDEAIEKIRVIGRINKKEVPTKLIEQFKESISNSKIEESQSWLEIFRRPIIRKMFILVCLEYMCCSLVFDGLIRSIGQLDFDYFVSFSVISFTEFPSVILVAFVMDYLGRRWMCIIFMSICCVLSILTVFTSGVYKVALVVMARFAVNMGYSAIIQWAPEVLPTPVRGSGGAIVHICGFLAAFISPYVIYLKEFVYWLPLVVNGAIAGLAVLIAMGLPETARKGMPHTFEEAEELTKNQRLWTLPFLEKRKQKMNGHDNKCFEPESQF